MDTLLTLVDQQEPEAIEIIDVFIDMDGVLADFAGGLLVKTDSFPVGADRRDDGKIR